MHVLLYKKHFPLKRSLLLCFQLVMRQEDNPVDKLGQA